MYTNIVRQALRCILPFQRIKNLVSKELFHKPAQKYLYKNMTNSWNK